MQRTRFGWVTHDSPVGSRRSAGSVLPWVALCILLVALPLAAAACGESEEATTEPTATGATTFDVANVTADPDINAMLPDDIKSAGVMHVAADIPYPPWNMYVEEGSSEVTGFDYDMSQALGAKMGIEASFEQIAFDATIPALKAGKSDVAISCMYDNAERREVLDFVDYAKEGSAMVVKAGNPEGITTLTDLAGKTVAAQHGSTQAVFLEKLQKQFKSDGLEPMDILNFPKDSDALLAAYSGKAVADMSSGPGAEWMATKTDKYEVVRDPEYPNGYEPSVVGIGILKSRTQLRDAVQAALQALIDDGTYQLIIDKYDLQTAAVTSAEINQGT